MSKTIVIVGAGIVGVSTALWAQRDGHRVILLDRVGPAGGTSFGNGGVLASSAVVPVNTPDLWTKAPGMVLNPDSPLFLRWRYLPRALPWLARFMGNARDAQVRRAAAALNAIVGDSLADHRAMAAGTGAEKWIVASDYVHLYANRAAYEKSAYSWDIKRSQGFHPVEYEGAALRDYEPVFGPAIGFAAALPDHGRITDPGQYVSDLAAAVEAGGGQVLKAEVSGITQENGRVTGVNAGGSVIPCDALVVTAGAWSGPLARALGVTLPLESERGYHIELWNPSQMPRRPVMVSSGSFVVTPMEGRLRLAGIVELGGLKAAPSRAPFELLLRQIRQVMPNLTWEEASEWMGHRPTLTDSVPVIGAVPGLEGAFMGVGHQHVGLTGGPKTGRLLAQMLNGQRPNIDMTPYALERFQR